MLFVTFAKDRIGLKFNKRNGFTSYELLSTQKSSKFRRSCRITREEFIEIFVAQVFG